MSLDRGVSSFFLNRLFTCGVHKGRTPTGFNLVRLLIAYHGRGIIRICWHSRLPEAGIFWRTGPLCLINSCPAAVVQEQGELLSTLLSQVDTALLTSPVTPTFQQKGLKFNTNLKAHSAHTTKAVRIILTDLLKCFEKRQAVAD